MQIYANERLQHLLRLIASGGFALARIPREYVSSHARTNKISYFSHVIYVCFILPVIMQVVPVYLRCYRKVNRLRKKYNVDRELRYWQSRKDEVLEVGKRGYRLPIKDLGLNQDKVELINSMQQHAHEVIIADIDQDGFALSYFGPIKNVKTVTEEQFLHRKRFGLQIVCVDGYVGVKKHYKDRKSHFVNELKVLHTLGQADCNVPAVMGVDFDDLSLTFSYILGSVLRGELAKGGAVLHERDERYDSYYASVQRKQRRYKRAEEGTAVLNDLIGAHFVEGLFAELTKIHAAGVIGNDIKYGNAIIEERAGQPFWIDFEHAGYYPRLGKHSFNVLRDRDIAKFNLFFGTEKLSYKSIKEKINNKDVSILHDWDTPVYFESGLRIGPIWNTETGYGYWRYFLKHHLPPLGGKRILELGANNAFTAMQMMRHGAREVIGVESDNKYINQGKFVQAAFEWTDNTQYNFRYIQSNIGEIPKMDLGRFDIVVALRPRCDHQSVCTLIQHISTITDTVVFQCDSSSDKSSVDDVKYALGSHGFQRIEVIGQHRYRHSLVIGSRG